MSSSLRAAAITALLIVLTLGAAGRASAAEVTVTPGISGTGTIDYSSGGQCVGHGPNGAQTACPAAHSGPADLAAVILTAIPASGWRFDHWAHCPSVGAQQCVVSASGAATATATPAAVFRDDVAPTITPQVSYSTSAERTVTLSASSTEPGTVRCSFQGAACGPALSLPEGNYSFTVGGADESGNEAAPVTMAFSVVDTALVSGPPDVTAARSATFVATSGIGLAFNCTLDGVPVPGGCGNGTHSFTDVADGPHTVRIWAIAADGSYDHVPLERTWTVDPAAAPEPTPAPAPPATPVPPAAVIPPLSASAAPHVVRPHLAFATRRVRGGTRLTRLAVRGLPAGATVRATCRGCRTLTRRARGTTVRLPSFAGRTYRAGSRITVTVSVPGRAPTTLVLRFSAARR